MHPNFLLLTPSPQVALHYELIITWEKFSKPEEDLAEGAGSVVLWFHMYTLYYVKVL